MKLKTVQLIRSFAVVVMPLLALALAGCVSYDTTGAISRGSESTNASVARLHVGDTVTVVLDGPPEPIMPHEETITEAGTITLQYVGQVQAANKTTGELQAAIYKLYVPGFYRHLTVTVKTASDRVFYVRGEVNKPDRQQYLGQTTVTKAITSAGDFNPYANRRKVILIRANGQRFTLNCVDILAGKATDPQVYPGDQIEVTRSIF